MNDKIVKRLKTDEKAFFPKDFEDITEPEMIEFEIFPEFLDYFSVFVAGSFGKYNHICCDFCGEEIFTDGKVRIFCCDKMKEAIFRHEIEKIEEAKKKEEKSISDYRERLEKSGLEGFELGVTFKSYKTETIQQEEAKKACQLFAKDEETFSLILAGSVGVGKTHLACSTAKHIGFYKGKMFKILRCSTVISTEDLDELKKIPVLIIDDIGREVGSEARIKSRVGFISEIIEYRHRNELKTIYTTNFSIEALTGKYGSHITDRIIDKALIPERIEAESHRGEK